MTSLIQPNIPEEPIGPEPAPAPPPPAATPPEPDTFDRTYVEDLRREAAGYRTRAKAYEEAFEGYEDEQRDAFLEYAKLLHRSENGDQEATQILEEMFGGEDDTPPDEPEQQYAPEPVDYQAMARQAAEEVFQRYEQQRVNDEGVAAVRKAGEDLGYKFGSEEYILFVRGANEAVNRREDNPLVAGENAVKAYHQRIIDEYLAAKGGQADSSLAVPSGGGTAPNMSTRPYDNNQSDTQKWQAVRESALARFRGSQQG
jgi:hypothetical protein